MRSNTAHRLLAGFVGSLFLSTAFLPAASADVTFHTRLSAGDRVLAGDELTSRSGQHSLWVGPNINTEALILDGTCDEVILAESSPTATNQLIMQDDGNLVLYSDGIAIWHTSTNGHPGAWAAMQDDRNLVVYDANNRPLWASGTNCSSASSEDGLVGDPMTRTFLPGQYMESPNRQYRLIMQDDGNLVLYKGNRALWASNTRGSGNTFNVEWNNDLVIRDRAGKRLWHSGTTTTTSGRPYAVSLRLQDDGNLVLYRWNSTPPKAIWQTRTYGR